MKKPGAEFAFRPRNNILSQHDPDFTKSPNRNQPRQHPKSKNGALTSIDIMVNERALPKGHPLRPINLNEDSASAPKQPGKQDTLKSTTGADDLADSFNSLRVSNSASASQPSTSANTSARRTGSPDVFEVPPPVPKSRPTSSGNKATDDALLAFFSDRGHRDPFGRPSVPSGKPSNQHPKVMSSRKQKAAGVFNDRKSRPEHHRNDNKHRVHVPSVPTFQDRKADPPSLFSSIGPDANPAGYKPSGTFGEPEFYTDPNKASADLKALLEGGMEEEEKDAEQPEEAEDKESGALEGLNVKLLPHQVEGVDWMQGRELGPVKRGRVPKGGILADDMGLGKTLQTISLILSNQKPAKGEPRWKKQFENLDKTTLVVAPLALIRQWESEIKEKVSKSHNLKVCVHHGPQRTKKFQELARYDVVVTTYQVLVSEFGQSSDADDGPKAGCFGLHWWRVVLDEAHTIKNRNAKSTKACYALRSEYRWCLSGTPMQNSLEELQSLIKFLRIKPYDNLAEWKDQIEKPMKNGRGHVAVRRLHSLLRCFMKRRTKDILKVDGALNPGGKPTAEGEKSSTGFKVTERKVVTISSQFSPAERRFYDRLAARADESIERMQTGGMNYANALVLLLRLRQACNHPKLVEGKLDKDKDALSGEASQKTANADVDGLADMFGGMGIVAKACSICGRDLPKEIAQSDRDTCDECYGDLAYFNENETKQSKKPKKSKTKVKKVEKKAKVPASKPSKNRSRNRRLVIDSDDEAEEEEEEEEAGSWLVPEDERGQLHLGKAGGEKDENCEGGGEWIGDGDSENNSDEEEEEEDGSQLESFIVDDEASESHTKKKAKKPSPASEEDDEDSFVSATSGDQDISSSDNEDDDSGIDESEVDSEADNTVYRPASTGAHQILASAKIRQLMQILHKEAHEHKFIVFSQFTSMMDLVEPFFRKEGLKFTRYDGGMKNDEREASLDRLRNDPNTRILLCSLKCGSLGLNLTAATRVVILEPFWNPFVEEQAIDRVHRLTQTVDVIIYKITVEKTVEERILELQEKKRQLAETAIEGGMKKDVLKLGFKEIMDLFRRDGHQQDTGADRNTAYGAAAHSNSRPSSSYSTGRSSRGTPEFGGAPRRDSGKAKASREHAVYGRRW